MKVSPIESTAAELVAAVSRYGRTDPKVLGMRLRLVEDLFARCEDEDAIAVLDALVSDCEADLGRNHETTLVLANNRAMKLAECGLSQGVEELAALIPVAIDKWGVKDRRTLLIRSNFAAATGMAGNYLDAAHQIETLLKEVDEGDSALASTLRTNLASWRARSSGGRDT